MASADGKLNKINRDKAQSQWEALRNAYLNFGYSVKTIAGVENLPDMVFSANQSFPFLNSKNKPAVILSNMRSEFRKKEVSHFEKFYSDNEYEIHNLDSKCSFEGNGDALIRPGTREIYGGYGFRTDKNVYKEIESITGYSVYLLELKNEFFYHLDTCFAFLNKDTVAIVPEAFTSEGLTIIRKQFRNIIEIDILEAKNNFAGNLHCPDGLNVILHQGSTQLTKKLLDMGFKITELDTSEFIKSGGSVFCMKMMCY